MVEAPKAEMVAVMPPSGGLSRLDPQALLHEAIKTGAGIETLERLMALATTVHAMQAKSAWHRAMAQFNLTCPPLVKTKEARIIPARGGAGYKYKFAPLDEIMATITPVMAHLGLSVSWVSRMAPNAVSVECHVAHVDGHAESSGEITMPIGSAEGGGANPAQRVGIAASYAKRYSLLGIIGKAPEDDDDAQGTEGTFVDEDRHAEAPAAQNSPEMDTPITKAQQDQFIAIARGSGWKDAEVKAFLLKRGLASSKEIPQSKFRELCEALKNGTTGEPPAA